MATYNIVAGANSGSPTTLKPFLIRMVIDFSDFTFASGDILQGPELDEGTLIFKGWERVILAGNADTNNCKIGLTGDDDAYETSIALDVTGSAVDTTAEISIATTVVVGAQSSSARTYLLVTSGGAETVTSGIVELLFLATKVSGSFRG